MRSGREGAATDATASAAAATTPIASRARARPARRPGGAASPRAASAASNAAAAAGSPVASSSSACSATARPPSSADAWASAVSMSRRASAKAPSDAACRAARSSQPMASDGGPAAGYLPGDDDPAGVSQMRPSLWGRCKPPLSSGAASCRFNGRARHRSAAPAVLGPGSRSVSGGENVCGREISSLKRRAARTGAWAAPCAVGLGAPGACERIPRPVVPGTCGGVSIATMCSPPPTSSSGSSQSREASNTPSLPLLGLRHSVHPAKAAKAAMSHQSVERSHAPVAGQRRRRAARGLDDLTHRELPRADHRLAVLRAKSLTGKTSWKVSAQVSSARSRLGRSGG